MNLSHLRPFQVDPTRVDRQEIAKLVNKISIASRVSEIQELFDSNISLCAYLLKNGYIDYEEIYFLSTSLILDEVNRPDYICACYHPDTGVSWYAIVCGGPQDSTWNDEFGLTKVGKKSFDLLNYCVSNLGEVLVRNKLIRSVDPDTVYGLMIIGQDKEFTRNKEKQSRKRDMNENSAIQLRTYGAFLRRYRRQKRFASLTKLVKKFTKIFK